MPTLSAWASLGLDSERTSFDRNQCLANVIKDSYETLPCADKFNLLSSLRNLIKTQLNKTKTTISEYRLSWKVIQASDLEPAKEVDKNKLLWQQIALTGCVTQSIV